MTETPDFIGLRESLAADADPSVLSLLQDSWCWDMQQVGGLCIGYDTGQIVVPNHDLHLRPGHNWATYDLQSGEWQATEPFMFPIAWHRPELPTVVCESVVDALALHALDQNAITVIGQDPSIDMIPRLSCSEVVLVPENRETCAWAVKLAESMRRRCNVRIIYLDDGLTTLLRPHDDEGRAGVWQHLVDTADIVPVAAGYERAAAGLRERDGMIVEDRSGRPVAMWTGEVLESGIDKTAEASRPDRLYRLRIQHTDGSELEVFHRHGQTLNDSIQRTPGAGGKWTIEKRWDDAVMVFLGRTSKHERQVNMGWSLGWNGDEFWTPSFRLTVDGVRPQSEMRFDPPSLWHTRFRFTEPRPETALRASELAIRHLIRCHAPEVTLGLLGTSVGAVLRRRMLPETSRWVTYLLGPPASGKTSRARLFQSLFGEWRTDHDLLTWRSSVRALEEEMSVTGDVMAVIDDLSSDRLTSAVRREAMDMLHGVAQGGARVTLARGTEWQEASRVLPVVTSESLPSDDQATMARGLHIRLPNRTLVGEPWNEHYDACAIQPKLMQAILPTIVLWSLRKDADRSRWAEILRESALGATRALDMAHPTWRAAGNALRFQARLTHTLAFATYGLTALSEVAGELFPVTDEESQQALISWATETGSSVQTETDETARVLTRIGERLKSGDTYLRVLRGTTVVGQYPPAESCSENAAALGFLELLETAAAREGRPVNARCSIARTITLTIWVYPDEMQRLLGESTRRRYLGKALRKQSMAVTLTNRPSIVTTQHALTNEGTSLLLRDQLDNLQRAIAWIRSAAASRSKSSARSKTASNK